MISSPRDFVISVSCKSCLSDPQFWTRIERSKLPSNTLSGAMDGWVTRSVSVMRLFVSVYFLSLACLAWTWNWKMMGEGKLSHLQSRCRKGCVNGAIFFWSYLFALIFGLYKFRSETLRYILNCSSHTSSGNQLFNENPILWEVIIWSWIEMICCRFHSPADVGMVEWRQSV